MSAKSFFQTDYFPSKKTYPYLPETLSHQTHFPPASSFHRIHFSRASSSHRIHFPPALSSHRIHFSRALSCHRILPHRAFRMGRSQNHHLFLPKNLTSAENHFLCRQNSWSVPAQKPQLQHPQAKPEKTEQSG